MLKEYIYKSRVITYNLYGSHEYTIEVGGDDVWFEDLQDAYKFIDEQED